MTEEQLTALAIRGLVSQLPQPSQDRIFALVGKIQSMMKELPDDEGPMAIALIGADMAAKQ